MLRQKLAIKYASFKNDIANAEYYFKFMWRNIRTNGGFRLTTAGMKFLKELGLSFVTVNVTSESAGTGQFLVNLDRYLKAPYYLSKKQIIIFDDSIAVQVILYDGDLARYIESEK